MAEDYENLDYKRLTVRMTDAEMERLEKLIKYYRDEMQISFSKNGMLTFLLNYEYEKRFKGE